MSGDLDLDAIEARGNAAAASLGLLNHVQNINHARINIRATLAEDVPALVAEVRRLRAAVARTALLADWFESQPNWRDWGVHEQIRAHIRDEPE